MIKFVEEGDFARIMEGKLFRDLYSYQEKLEKAFHVSIQNNL